MKTWQCRCGHEVISTERPSPIKWTDGHECRFITPHHMNNTDIAKLVAALKATHAALLRLPEKDIAAIEAMPAIELAADALGYDKDAATMLAVVERMKGWPPPSSLKVSYEYPGFIYILAGDGCDGDQINFAFGTVNGCFGFDWGIGDGERHGCDETIPLGSTVDELESYIRINVASITGVLP